ncbi:hypothetical protein B0H14DRAFT_3516169 [Mycena olivaceomarginata]|nr:hypothetical protein B0H14DRAFT_3516169 [Mycena olivaceomarginata]
MSVKRNTRGSRIDLGNAKEEDLVALASACDRATFGMDQKDVLDECYRKAGKMDLAKFAARPDVVASGLVDAISPDILQGQTTDGPGSFFKAHMIGSLVVIFPTAHTGGALTLEHAGATLAYVAFYSDVTHAVEPVKTGHRVTLRYNLFLLDNDAHTAAVRVVPAPERALEAALRRLLANPSFLPSGGYLAYELSHQYPMPPPPEGEWDPAIRGRRMPPSRLGPVLRLLRGSDARVRTVSERKILYDSGANYYEGGGHDVLADDVLNTEDVNESYDMSLQAAIEGMGELEEKAGRAGEGWDYNEDKDEEEETPLRDAVEVHWVTKITELNRVSSTYVAYGNDASLQHVYGNAALFVHVPAFGEGIRA